MKTAICTISTKDHLFKTQALFQSLKKNTDAKLFCLITDAEVRSINNVEFTAIGTDRLQGELADNIKAKYYGDQLRWACKPLMLLWLLEQGYEKVIYLDNDIFFFSPADFLFDLLDQNSVVLTPHFYLSDPAKEQFWLEANFRIGLYNAGFIGVNTSGKDALKWWASCCAYNIKKSAWRGLFDDQKYLDMFPILFDHVHILKHLGCNVAFWNIGQRNGNLNSNGELVFEGEQPLVFIHFTKGTLRFIQRGFDPLLLPYLEDYEKTLKKFSPTIEIAHLTRFSLQEAFDYTRHLIWLFMRKFDR